MPTTEGTRFRVLAPRARRLEVQIESPRRRVPMRRLDDAIHEAVVPGVRAGDRYRIVLDGEAFPDPASRHQPEGVHGASAVVHPGAFAWRDAAWRGTPLEGLVLYEVHVGSFTPEGTFAALTVRLPALRDLGVTAIELMPLADFPGERNWGYDGAALFAPARCYGAPDDLRRLVDAAHELGLGVHLDVVYNHLGPDGAYAAAFHPGVFSERHRNPWGAGIDLDGPRAAWTRGFFIENALHWIHEYHVDGLRLDATHAMVDGSPRHFLAELGARVRATTGGRTVLLIAEDARNLARIVRPEANGGWGMDAVWSDDFHHVLRRMLAGDHESYFQDFRGTADELAATLRQGWLYTGQHSAYADAPRGSDPAGVDPARFVIFVQNHDQIGNRAHGDRLHHGIDVAAYRAAVTLLLCAPQTPLLFMGQEWAASAPFRFFTDHHGGLGEQVTAGRRDEFRRFAAFSDPAHRAAIPDPQSIETFVTSRPDWSERDRAPHAGVLRLHQALLALRRERLTAAPLNGHDARAPDADTVWLERRAADGTLLHVVARLRGSGTVRRTGVGGVRVVLATEDAAFCEDPMEIRVRSAAGAVTLDFRRPGAIVLGVAS